MQVYRGKLTIIKSPITDFFCSFVRGGRPLRGFGSVGFEIRLLRVSGLAVRKSHFKCLYSLRSDCKSARAGEALKSEAGTNLVVVAVLTAVVPEGTAAVVDDHDPDVVSIDDRRRPVAVVLLQFTAVASSCG